MLSSIKRYLANQARKPSGWFGRIVAPRVLNKTNGEMEDFGLELMNPQNDDSILEIGFGNGRLISVIIPKLNDGKVCGIDISDEMVELAAERNSDWIDNGKVDLHKASVADIPYPENHFDKIFTCNTIYFWPDPAENMKEVKRVLKPEGQFFCAFRDKKLMQNKSSAVTENRDIFQNLYHPREIKQLFEDQFHEADLKKRSANGETFHIAIGRE